MSESNQTSNHTTPVSLWFWVIGAIALLWNLMGLMAFAVQMAMTDETIAKLPEAQQEIYRNMPSWVIVCFAFAVCFGVLGCVLLLLRNKLAIPALILSLIGVLGQYGYMFFISNTAEVMGAGAMVLPAIVVLISIALVPYAISCKQKGKLK
ncbi:hypothetical protein [Mariniblastus fucicola]|uniref:Sugar transporter n=1 Tax=Mariniblastus fucicola TaxID=980251 RepID=A0A5B9PMQ9_9BACT|nr:hypothetical protein [Mariniblastus fucicola]QEG23871.1 hypothetical protein MFFC18_37750 [Mariniblastus fucicola]